MGRVPLPPDHILGYGYGKGQVNCEVFSAVSELDSKTGLYGIPTTLNHF